VGRQRNITLLCKNKKDRSEILNFALEYAIRKVEESEEGYRLLVYAYDLNLLGRK
jgi:hypothetical protein